MEKEIDKKNLVLKEDESIGTVQIADDVVAMIASLAATEVDGVSAMAVQWSAALPTGSPPRSILSKTAA